MASGMRKVLAYILLTWEDKVLFQDLGSMVDVECTMHNKLSMLS